jgi:hypothetical protein
MLGKMNLKRPSWIATAFGLSVLAILALAAFATWPGGTAKYLAEAARYSGVALLTWLILQEKSLRNFAIAVGVLFICGAATSALLDQTALVMVLFAGITGVLLTYVLAADRWKSAAFVAARIMLVTLLIFALMPLTGFGSFGFAVASWIMLGVYWAWRKLGGRPGPEDRWSADRDADGTWRA